MELNIFQFTFMNELAQCLHLVKKNWVHSARNSTLDNKLFWGNTPKKVNIKK